MAEPLLTSEPIFLGQRILLSHSTRPRNPFPFGAPPPQCPSKTSSFQGNQRLRVSLTQPCSRDPNLSSPTETCKPIRFMRCHLGPRPIVFLYSFVKMPFANRVILQLFRWKLGITNQCCGSQEDSHVSTETFRLPLYHAAGSAESCTSCNGENSISEVMTWTSSQLVHSRQRSPSLGHWKASLSITSYPQSSLFPTVAWCAQQRAFSVISTSCSSMAGRRKAS